MLIRFTRLTNERHRFEIVRDDGTREAHELETRSALIHDLAHYAVEAEARLEESFYGRLAQGIPYSELIDTPPNGREALDTEAVVAMLQGTVKVAQTDPVEFTEKIKGGFGALGQEPPGWLTGDFMARALDRLRRVHGQWRATTFHRTMELEFPRSD